MKHLLITRVTGEASAGMADIDFDAKLAAISEFKMGRSIG